MKDKSIAIISRDNTQKFESLYHHLEESYEKVVFDSNAFERIENYDVFIIAYSFVSSIIETDIDGMLSVLNNGKAIALFVSTVPISTPKNSLSTFDSNVESNQFDPKKLTLLNDFLSKYGISLEDTGVIRSIFSKYLHPKNTLITDGILHPDLQSQKSVDDSELNHRQGEGSFVYPYGCSMDVKSPSWAVLSSGSLSFPTKRPLCAIWQDQLKRFDRTNTSTNDNRGRLLVQGSIEMFSNEWIDKENNRDILDVFIRFLCGERNVLARARINKHPDLALEEARTVPDIEALSERVKWCLEEPKPLPQDLNSMLFPSISSFDTTKSISKVMKLYNDLNVENEPLSLMKPEFKCPLPSLEPAVFQPRMINLNAPALELFDLDEEFAEPLVRLGKLKDTFKKMKKEGHDYSEDELEMYLYEAGYLSGLISQNNGNSITGKQILYQLFLALKDMKNFEKEEEDVLDNMAPTNCIEIKPM